MLASPPAMPSVVSRDLGPPRTARCQVFGLVGDPDQTLVPGTCWGSRQTLVTMPSEG
jgi:hypothetical protein